MSPEELSMCYGKEKLTEGGAKVASKRLRIGYYYCKYCGQYHAGKSNRRIKPKEKI